MSESQEAATFGFTGAAGLPAGTPMVVEGDDEGTPMLLPEPDQCISPDFGAPQMQFSDGPDRGAVAMADYGTLAGAHAAVGGSTARGAGAGALMDVYPTPGSEARRRSIGRIDVSVFKPDGFDSLT